MVEYVGVFRHVGFFSWFCFCASPAQCCLRDSARRHHSLSIQAEEERLMRVFTTSAAGTLVPRNTGWSPACTHLNTDHGWELYHGVVAQPNVVPTPSNALPMNRTPSAATPMIPPAGDR